MCRIYLHSNYLINSCSFYKNAKQLRFPSAPFPVSTIITQRRPVAGDPPTIKVNTTTTK